MGSCWVAWLVVIKGHYPTSLDNCDISMMILWSRVYVYGTSSCNPHHSHRGHVCRHFEIWAPRLPQCKIAHPLGHGVVMIWGTELGGHHLISGGGQGFGHRPKYFFTIIRQIYTFFHLLGHPIMISLPLHLFQLYLEGNYLFQQLAATNCLFYHLLKSSALNIPVPPSPWRLNACPHLSSWGTPSSPPYHKWGYMWDFEICHLGLQV